ncbi:MAG: hypothetical protein LC099_01610 [Anaerolineales bacterium]|nr:hypothetical protein [Anaerolineales bacterium]
MIRRLALCACLLLLLNACGGAAEIPSEPTLLPQAESTPTGAAPALPEFRRLTLEYPPTIKLGSGSQLIILILEADAQGNLTPTATYGGNATRGEVVEIPNLYKTHKVTAEAYYEVAGLNVAPRGSTFQPLREGERLYFAWSVQPQEVGLYRGTVFLFLNFENRETGEKERKAISIQMIEIKVADLFGFSTNFVKNFGVSGSLLAVIVGFPFFEEAVKYLYRRLKPKKSKSKPKKKK